MRYISLRIANYRGVSEAKIEFGGSGITLVRGPNEAGKTSLGEAIRLLFDYHDNSKHRDVIAIKPVHRDVGPEIELEAESGSYRFTYLKRFFKKPETRLIIVRPKPENYIGRQAHERAEAILRETLDVDLWKALSIRQGTEINQPILAGQTWLSAALDRAAGGHSADAHAEDLFEAVRMEYLRYFTESGAEKREVIEHRKALTDCHSEVQRIEQVIRDLEHDVDQAAGLKRELSRLRRSELDIVVEVEKRSTRLREIAELDQHLSDAKLKLEAATASEKAARAEQDNRERLINEIVDATKAAADMGESASSDLTSLNQAKEEFGKAQKAYSDAHKKRKEILEVIDLLRRDHEYLRAKLDLELLQERRTRIDRAREEATKSELALATNKVDEQALESIEAAQTAAISADAKLEAKAPVVLLRGLVDCGLTKDGAVIKLRQGEERSFPVPDIVKFAVPGKVEIEITAGSSVDMLARKAEEARTKLNDICTSLGITGADKAREAFEQRQKASRQIANLKQVEKENLRDLSYDKLAVFILGLQQSVPAYLPDRVLEPAILDNLVLAEAELREAEKVRDRAEKEWVNAESGLDEVKRVCEKWNNRYIEARTRWEHLKEDLTRQGRALESERATSPDEVISMAMDNAMTSVAKAHIGVIDTDSSLKALNSEKERELDRTAKESLSRILHRVTEADRELIEVSTRLKINGQDGLYEKLSLAQAALEGAKYRNASLIRRAAAAKLLYETMRQERDKAHHAYVAPLKKRIESLGRLVFDDTLQVDVSDNLQIVSRTLNGATVDFDSLSGGTKEQLSLIFRLACAMIVAMDGGAPVMLDDALGYTDPDRLRLMGAVLAKAAKECQIVIFTCVPDRYSNVGVAKEIVMR